MINVKKLLTFAIYCLHFQLSSLSSPTLTNNHHIINKNNSLNFPTYAYRKEINRKSLLSMEISDLDVFNFIIPPFDINPKYSSDDVIRFKIGVQNDVDGNVLENVSQKVLNNNKNDKHNRNIKQENIKIHKSQSIYRRRRRNSRSVIDEILVQPTGDLLDMHSLVITTTTINSSSTVQPLYNENNLNSTLIHPDGILCDESLDENCVIDHTKYCVGDRQYCNLTYEEYMGILYEYITPTPSEWILIVSHAFVFIMGLVSKCLLA